MSPDVARGHGDDGGGDDHPPPHQIPTGCGGCLGNRGKGSQKPNFGGRRAGRMHTRQETRNLELKSITNKNGPVPIWFEFGDRETLMPLGDHTAHWSNYLGDLVRELPLHHSFWRQVSPKQKAGVMAKIGITSSPNLNGSVLSPVVLLVNTASAVSNYGVHHQISFDVVVEDDDIIDEEDHIPHDLADSDDEDLVNLDIDDGINVVYSSEEED
ncbi:hypothetical protein Tco_1568923 [Tanacetum coccineum]